SRRPIVRTTFLCPIAATRAGNRLNRAPPGRDLRELWRLLIETGGSTKCRRKWRNDLRAIRQMDWTRWRSSLRFRYTSSSAGELSPRCLRTRMKSSMHGFETLLIYVRVNLCGRDVRVAQHFLNDPE